MGYEVEDSLKKGIDTSCCGFGGMVAPVDPALTQKVREKRKDELKSEHVVTYCAGCRESMELAGKDAVHILDLVFKEKYTKDSIEKRLQSSGTQWKNRYNTKRKLMKLDR